MNDILKVTWRVTYICKHIPCTSQLAVKGHIDTLHKNNDNVKPTKSSFHCYKKYEMWIVLIDLLLSFSTCSYCIGNNDICFLTSRFRGFKGLLPSFLSNMRSAITILTLCNQILILLTLAILKTKIIINKKRTWYMT